MIGIDTNVLVRYLTQDDPAQARRVDSLVNRAIAENDVLYIDAVVLVETVWVLRARFRYTKAEIIVALDELVESAVFEFEDRNSFRLALHAFRNGSGNFADYFIGLRNVAAGCEHTVTFDRGVRNRPSFVLL